MKKTISPKARSRRLDTVLHMCPRKTDKGLEEFRNFVTLKNYLLDLRNVVLWISLNKFSPPRSRPQKLDLDV